MIKILEKIKNPNSGKRIFALGIVYIAVFGALLFTSIAWQLYK